jgi:DNA repair protein RecN (Recombination protein N)
MLTFLRITDFALIEALELELGPGLTVLSGETGAGKSIILAAVDLLLGRRASADLIRAGAEAAVVEAQFALDPEGPAAARLAQAGLEAGEELVVRRVVSREGKNRVQINGALATLGLLAELGPELVALCGQHAHQDLLRPGEHLVLLDAFAGLEERRGGVAAAVAEVRRLEAARQEKARALARREERREELAATVAELEAAELDPEEEEALKAERRLLANAEQVARLAGQAQAGLVEAEGAAVEVLGRARGLLAELARLDPRAEPLSQRLDEVFFQAEDLAHDLQAYSGRLSFEPGRQDWVERRLHELQRLTRKHGGDVAGALEVLAEARAELAGLQQGEEELQTLEARRDQALEEALALARELSARRRRAAGRLAAAAGRELAGLGLASCRLEVELAPPAGAGAVDTPEGPLSSRGLEQAEIFIEPNPGEGLRPLRRIASGGELSRILLALKGLVASRRGAPTQIFDEVDAGIGGETGFAVGRRLKRLSRGAQVLVITHLPQIAAFADRHFTVQKQAKAGRTITRVAGLDQAGRVEELARMLTGGGAEATAREHARRLMDEAGQAA